MDGDMLEWRSSSLRKNRLESEFLIPKELDLEGVRVGRVVGWSGAELA